MAKKMAPFVFSWRYLAFAKYQSSLLNLILTLKKNTGNILDISIMPLISVKSVRKLI